MKYQLFVALRYLRAKHKQAFTSVITVISILGIAIGVMALVVAISLMTGMHDQIRENILGSRAHISIYGGSTKKTIENFEELRGQLKSVEGVIDAAPVIIEEGLLRSRFASEGVAVHGIDPGSSESVINVFQHITVGDWRSMTRREGEYGRKGVLLGDELARSLGVLVGDSIRLLTSSTSSLSPVGMLPVPRTYRVAAIFSTGDWLADSRYCYIPLVDLQKTLGLGDAVTMLQVKTDDIFKADEIKDRIDVATGGRLIMRTWIEENSMFFEALQLEKLAMLLTITLIVAVASLNIISTLIMMVMEKHRDIGVLMSMGATSRGIMSAFMLQGLIIGVIGTTIGAALGAGLSWFLDYFEVIKLPGEVYTITRVHFKIIPLDILLVSSMALIISLLATLYPAWKASRLLPTEALRYE